VVAQGHSRGDHAHPNQWQPARTHFPPGRLALRAGRGMPVSCFAHNSQIRLTFRSIIPRVFLGGGMRGATLLRLRQ
jgi:hypothetical protein